MYSAVRNNGHTANWFPLTRSCRQGCPLSALIYTLIVELLGDKIRNNKNMRGIKLLNDEIKGAQYADDLWLALIYVTSELDKFYQFSRLKVNYDKTIVMQIGPAPFGPPLDTNYPLQWSQGPIKILGIYMHPDTSIIAEINYSPLLQKVRDRIMMWRYRSLTIVGKIQIVNSLIASLFPFRFACLPSPSNEFVEEYDKLISTFLWGNKTKKIPRDKLIKQYQDGGLKLIDMAKDQAIKANLMSDINSPIYYDLPIKTGLIWDCSIKQLDI